MTPNEELHQIFNCNLDELRNLSIFNNSLTRNSIYIELLIAYLVFEKKKVERLLKLIEKASNLEDHKILYNVCKFRLKVMQRSVEESDIDHLLTTVENFPHWNGEVFNIIAYNYMTTDNFKSASFYFKKAHIWFNIKKINRRAILAHHNFIICEGNLNLKQTTIPDLMFLLKEVSKFNYNDIKSLILMNLAREYQNYNANNLALKYCLEAEEYSLDCIGALRFWSIKCLKADILIDLKRIHEAHLCVEELSACEHKENKEAVKLLKLKLSSKEEEEEDINVDYLQPTWKQRFNGDNHRVGHPPLGELEQKLVDFIMTSPRSKNEIIEHLYGNKIDYSSLENRFKRLISRTRKKIPDLILFIDKRYKVSDQVFAQRIL